MGSTRPGMVPPEGNRRGPLRRLIGRLSRCLLASRLRHVARLQAALGDSLELAVWSGPERTAADLAILEGAMAIVLADGEFNQQERELYASCLARFDLADDQWQRLTRPGAVDLDAVVARLAELGAGAQRWSVASCYCLFAAADGATDARELAVLRTLLEPLGHAALAADLPQLYRRFRLREGLLQRWLGDWGEALARWANPQGPGARGAWRVDGGRR